MTMTTNKDDIKAARAKANITQKQAAETVYATSRAWQRWESGEREMSPADWELFLLKTNQHPTLTINPK